MFGIYYTTQYIIFKRIIKLHRIVFVSLGLKNVHYTYHRHSLKFRQNCFTSQCCIFSLLKQIQNILMQTKMLHNPQPLIHNDEAKMTAQCAICWSGMFINQQKRSILKSLLCKIFATKNTCISWLWVIYFQVTGQWHDWGDTIQMYILLGGNKSH